MNTSLKVILTAVGIAVLASPGIASASHLRAAPSATSISNAHGSVAGTRTAPVIEGNQIHIDDAVHVPFPQQGGGV
jgi:hypothetical protein